MLVEFHSRGTMNDDGAMDAHKLPITVAHAQFLSRNIPGNCNKPFTEVMPTFPQARKYGASQDGGETLADVCILAGRAKEKEDAAGACDGGEQTLEEDFAWEVVTVEQGECDLGLERSVEGNGGG